MAFLDTHRMVKQLVAVGFTDAQAESVTEVVTAARGFDVENLATKADLDQRLAELRHAMDQQGAELRQALDQQGAELRHALEQQGAELRHAMDQQGGELRAELRNDIARLEVADSALRAAIAESKSEILRWIVGLAITQIGLIVALVKLLPGH